MKGILLSYLYLKIITFKKVKLYQLCMLYTVIVNKITSFFPVSRFFRSWSQNIYRHISRRTESVSSQRKENNISEKRI